MSQVDYAAMSYKELRRYFLKHRDDQAAFQAYLARRRERSRQLLEWFLELDHQRWDKQLEQDIADGKLEALAEEAIADFETGNYRAI